MKKIQLSFTMILGVIISILSSCREDEHIVVSDVQIIRDKIDPNSKIAGMYLVNEGNISSRGKANIALKDGLNLKNAFSLAVSKNEFPYRRVALVDDVITTGSTLNEISKLLRKLGVEEIQVWGLARA